MITKAQVEPVEGLADELEQLLAKRADRSVPGGQVHDRLTHFVEANKVVILAALRSSTVNDELTDYEIEEALVSEGIFVWGPDGERFERMFEVVMKQRRAALAKIGDE